MKNLGLVCWGFALLGCGGTSAVPELENAAGDVAPGDTLTTDTEGDGVSAEDPIETSVTSPQGGTVSIREVVISEDPPDGAEFFGQQINIQAPNATAEEPLVLVFTLDGSVVPSGEDEDSVQLFRLARLVGPSCTGDDGVAEPDPCVSERRSVDGNVVLTALTSAASPWNFGTVEEDVGPPVKGELDISALQEEAWPVLIDGDLATVTVPFSTRLPASIQQLDDPAEELADHLTLVVANEDGVSVDIADGTLVNYEPDGPGKFTFEFNDARTEATMVFWNESTEGLTLKAGRSYEVSISITGSDYIEDLDSSAFEVTPEEE